MAERSKKIKNFKKGLIIAAAVKYCIYAGVLLWGVFALAVRDPEGRASGHETERVLALNELELSFLKSGLVDVNHLDPEIAVKLKYSSTDNFTGANLYGGLQRAYLQREAAEMLAKASARLRELYPGYRLLVADAARPLSVQKVMYSFVKNTPRQWYIANPGRTSIHNYGAAVDLTILDSSGEKLDMGTPLDYFGPLAEPRREQEFLESGKLTEDQVANRGKLRDVMIYAGFIPLSIEWWHFNAFNRETTLSRYELIE